MAGWALAFAALTGIGAVLRVPLSPVPVTMQVFFALLAGLALGPVWGPASQAAYILMGLCGAPFFAAAPYAGPAVLFGPTGGYLWGFVLAAWAAGLIGEKARRRRAGRPALPAHPGRLPGRHPGHLRLRHRLAGRLAGGPRQGRLAGILAGSEALHRRRPAQGTGGGRPSSSAEAPPSPGTSESAWAEIKGRRCQLEDAHRLRPHGPAGIASPDKDGGTTWKRDTA